MSLTINLLYNSINWGYCRMEDILHDPDILIIDDISFTDFIGNQGGIEIIIDDFKIIYRGISFYDLEESVIFLIKTILELGFLNKDNIKNLIDKENSDIYLIDNNDDKLLFKNLEIEDEVLLSFLSCQSEKTWSRNNPYFKNLKFTKNDWFEAAYLALDEFFSILKKIKEPNVNCYSYNLMKNW